MSKVFEVISGSSVNDIISINYNELVNRTAAAYTAFHDGEAVNPNSHFLNFPKKPDARIIALPAHFDGALNVSGIKWISSFPSNLNKGIPRASAVMILNDYETGYPFACIEASMISAARTAASAVLAAYHLNKKNKKINRLGVIGTGLIARYIIDFFKGTDWDINELSIFDQSDTYVEQFRDRMKKDHAFDVCIENHADDVIRHSDIVVFATTSGEPYIKNWDAFENNPLVLHVSLRDIAPEIILKSHNVVDDVEHCVRANTSPHLASQKVGNTDFINTTLPKILSGDNVPDRDKPIIFSPFGMGVLDLAFAYYIYEQATAMNKTHEIPDFFYDMKRV